jgi:hypothetical protein
MNIINAGNPSANNMIIRQVMQKKRQSSATIFDKLTKRTAKLTAKNPLNNVLTNDQLFRYYIQEVEPKLSQSNDNFSGLPNMTPPDNSIKDTIEKDFKDGYNAGSGGVHPGCLSLAHFLKYYFCHIVSLENICAGESFYKSGLDGKASSLNINWVSSFTTAVDSVIPHISCNCTRIMQVNEGHAITVIV